MNLKPGLWQQQTIKLAMTQELKQAIILLQYSNQELLEFLENKALENPLIQIETPQVMAPRYDCLKKLKRFSDGTEQQWIEQMAKKETSLLDYLFSQIDFRPYDNRTKRLLSFLINSLDRNGYLHLSIEEVASILSVPDQEIEEALHTLQGLEPAGIGAKDLQECLLLQIKQANHPNPLVSIIIEDYFTLFAERKWKLIAKELGVQLKQIQEVFDYVITLNPRPAASFSYEQTTYIVPDLIMKWEGEQLMVGLCDDSLPKIHFNKKYFQRFRFHGDQHVKKFLYEKQQDFHWIMRSIEQRKETIIKVAMKIIEKQPEYFRYGPERLKPMTMKEIAEELDIHESTVSRAVREKYAQTPFGTVELKSFFSSMIKTISSEETSSARVKKEMVRLIDQENKVKPFSDQELVRLLEDKSKIIVSRRTIAKYREQLGIPSSTKRKRFE